LTRQRDTVDLRDDFFPRTATFLLLVALQIRQRCGYVQITPDMFKPGVCHQAAPGFFMGAQHQAWAAA